MISLAAFLGNPGQQYCKNRHNVPWLLADKLPTDSHVLWRKKFKGLWADIEGSRLPDYLPDQPAIPDKIHFLKPATFMNRSGESVIEAATFFKIKPEGIIVIHDELELPLGTISLKFGGGLGGHNGLRSMKACFNTADFWRLRIGIGRPDSRLPGQGGKEGSGEGIVEWVLSDFDKNEMPVLEPALEAASGLLLNLLARGPEKFLPQWSKVKIIENTNDKNSIANIPVLG